MPPTPDIATAATQQLLDALAERPDASAAELADAAGIGRSTASKLLVTLAAQGRVLRRPGGHQGGGRTPERWTLITTTATTWDTTVASTARPATPAVVADRSSVLATAVADNGWSGRWARQASTSSWSWPAPSRPGTGGGRSPSTA